MGACVSAPTKFCLAQGCEPENKSFQVAHAATLALPRKPTFFLLPLHFCAVQCLLQASWLLSSSQIVAFSSSFPQQLVFQVHQLRLAQAAVMDQLIRQLGHYAGLLLTFIHIDVDQTAFFAIF